MSECIKIDGSLGEGGGQVLRIALAISSIFKVPIEIENIRAGRPKPGLAAQHLSGVELAQSMCNAQVEGAYLGSTRLKFQPGDTEDIKKREFIGDTKTAGCICLMAQVAIPIALFYPPGEPIKLILKGGTNVTWGPHIEYLTEVFRPWLNKFGADFSYTVLKRGYYPKGGGEFWIEVPPIKNLNPIQILDPGNVKTIFGWAYVAGSVPLNEAYRMADVAKNLLVQRLTAENIPIPPINIEAYREDREIVVGNGSGINIICQTDTECVYGGSGLFSRDIKSDPGVEAAELLIDPIINHSCIDDYMQDQIILVMALAKGISRVSIGISELTEHTKTAIEVVKILLKNHGISYQLIENPDSDYKSFILECNSTGLNNLHY